VVNREVEYLTESIGELINDTAVPPASEVTEMPCCTLPEVTRVVTVLGDGHADSFKVLGKKRFNADFKSGAQAFGYLGAVDTEAFDRRIKHPQRGYGAALALEEGIAEQSHSAVLSNEFPVNLVVHDNSVTERVSEVADTFLNLDVAVTFHLEGGSGKSEHESGSLLVSEDVEQVQK
jgi:hypothetical protein